MKIQGNIGEAFDNLKMWMKHNRKPSDRLGETFEEWKGTVISMYGCDVSDGVLRPMYDEGCYPFTAVKRLQSFK